LPSLDVITVTYNSERHIERCLKSIEDARHLIGKYIVIDGGSSDGTIDIVAKYKHIISHYVSEPDGGISDAMNKGICCSNADFILIVHSDDWLIRGALEVCLPQLALDDEVLCTTMLSYSNDNFLGAFKSNPSLISSYNSMLHPGCIISRITYDRIGLYSRHRKIAMDYDFFSRCFNSGVKFRVLDRELVAFSEGGVSGKSLWRIQYESFASRRLYHGAIIPWHETKGFSRSIMGRILAGLGLKTMLKNWINEVRGLKNQKLDVAFNKAAHNANYRKYAMSHPDIFNDVEQRRLSGLIAEIRSELAEPAPAALDFGCGSGNITDHLITAGFRVTSADVAENFLKLVAENHKLNPSHETCLLTGDIDVDLSGRKFDVICMYSVLHHIPDYLLALKSLAAKVSSGGILFIDHESSPSFWADSHIRDELDAKYGISQGISNLKKLIKFSWYINKYKMLRNPRYQPDGDIHVWPDDHIEWDLIESLMTELGFQVICLNDYLNFKPYYKMFDYESYSSKISDMRCMIFKKIK
jgi:glycosyltransferase involved in cell wall biosynthesis